MASFFFFRGSGDRSRAARFARTIAAQMAASIPATATFIEAAIKAHPGLLDSSALETQFQLLVLEPFLSALSVLDEAIQEPVLIVVDGFDECDDTEDAAMLIEYLITFYDDNATVPLRFFIASRVEEHIRTRLEAPQVYLLSLVKHAADADIAIVVDATFERAAKHDRVIRTYGGWPILRDKRRLIKSAGGSFILLSMLLKFVLSPTEDGQTPMDRLPLAIDGNLGGLDDLYTQTLTRSKHLPHFSLIVSTLALLQEPLPILSLATLLDIRKHEVVQVLINLQAIIQVPGDDDTPVVFFHTSLRDFLVTESRSGCFYVSPAHHRFLAFRCFTPPGENDIGGKRGNDLYIILYRKMHWRSHFQSFLDHFNHPRYIGELRRHIRAIFSHVRGGSSVKGDSFLTYCSLIDAEVLTNLHDSSTSGKLRLGKLVPLLLPSTVEKPYLFLHPKSLSHLAEPIHLLQETWGDLLDVYQELESARRGLFSEVGRSIPLCHLNLLLGCTEKLFVRLFTNVQSVMGHLQPPEAPDSDVFRYAFLSFGRHLALAIINNSFEFGRSALWEPDFVGYGTSFTDVHAAATVMFNSASRCDMPAILSYLKHNIESADSAIDRFLAVSALCAVVSLPYHADSA